MGGLGYYYITLKQFYLFAAVFTFFVLPNDALRSNTKGFCQKVVKLPKIIRRMETYLPLDSVPVECQDLDKDESCVEYRKSVKRRIVTKQIFQSRSIRTCCTGYYKYSRFCLPHCEPECENGVCSDPNVCTCHEGYKNSNFYYKCVPDCGDTCVNGECTAPNVCNCTEGYHKNSDGVCEAMCENECVNGTCVGSNTCECNHGFVLSKDEKYTCEPSCSSECKFGTCSAPEQCECLKGYTMAKDSKSECQPICDSCENGNCLAPNTCQCNDGFVAVVQQKDNRNLTLCSRKCDSGYKLVNETCVPDCGICINGKCVSPGLCECLKGYVKEENGNATLPASSLKVCKPFCSACYEPNKCVSPNNCSCHPNYRSKKVYVYLPASKIEVNTCQLYCFPPCANNTHCIEDNICACNDLYHLGRNGCEKICDPECIFGECENGTCVCEPGFKLAVNSTHNCEPYCNVTCKNGHCVDGKVCKCDDGYTLHNDTECIPVCDKTCVNGTCFEPNICECFEGYHKFGYDNDNVCVPVCNELSDAEEDAVSIENYTGCLHGVCVAPYVCQCDDGYELSNKYNFTCIPKNDAKACINCYSEEKLPKKVSWRTVFIIIFAILLLVTIVASVYLKFNHHSRSINEKGVGLSFHHLLEDSADAKQPAESNATTVIEKVDFSEVEELRF